MNARSSPYQGIRNYEETDWEWFFGRRKDRQIIISNLFSSPLTVYYGASGVGKTSLLLADVVPVLKRIKQPPDVTAADRKRYERVIVVVFRKWQDKDFQKGLRVAVLTAVAETLSSRNPNADLNPENLFKDLSVPLADTISSN